MGRRLATVLLAVAVVFGGFAARSHSQPCCITTATAHDCCKAAEALRASPDCCKGASELAHRAVTAKHSIHHGFTWAVTLPAATILPPADLAVQPVRACGLAPPGSLTAQHTSLLL